MDSMRRSILFRAIGIVLISTFIALDISWAYPTEHNTQASTLATPSLLQQNPITEHVARFQKSLFSQSALLTSVFDIGEYFYGNERKGIGSLPSDLVNTAIDPELRQHLTDAGTEILNIVPVEHIKQHSPEKLQAALDGIGFKGDLPDEGVVFILYKKGDKRFLVQIARRDSVSADNLPGYEWVVSDKYVVKYIPESYQESSLHAKLTSPDMAKRKPVSIIRDGIAIIRDNTRQVKGIISSAVEEFNRAHPDQSGKFAFLLVGSSGRGEMCYKSDIDYLIVHDARTEKKDMETLKSGITQALRSAGFNDMSAFAVGSKEFIINCGRYSLIERLALNDISFVAGDWELFEGLRLDIDTLLNGSSQDELDDAILNLLFVYERYRNFSAFDSAQPDIKKGRGGVREIQNFIQIAQIKYGIRGMGLTQITDKMASMGVISSEESAMFKEAAGFIFAVRNRMHKIEGKESDILTSALQARIARELGFADTASFMKAYKQHGKNVRNTVRRLKGALRKEIDGRRGSDWAEKFRKALQPDLEEWEYRKLLKDSDDSIKLALAWNCPRGEILENILEQCLAENNRNWNIMFALAHSPYSTAWIFEKLLSFKDRGNSYRMIPREVTNNKHVPVKVLASVTLEAGFEEKAVTAAKKTREARIGVLISELGDERATPEQRKKAAEELGQSADLRVIKELKKALSDNYETVRLSASIALSDIERSSAVEKLIDTAMDQRASVSERAMAIDSLRSAGFRRAIRPCITIIGRKEDDAEVRTPAISLLADFGAIVAIEPLIKILKDESEPHDIRRAAAYSLYKIKGSIVITGSLQTSLLVERAAIESALKETDLRSEVKRSPKPLLPDIAKKKSDIGETGDSTERSFNEARIREQLDIIIHNFNRTDKETKIDEIISWVNENPVKNLKGEEVHVLDGTGPEAKEVGRIDRNIAEKFGFIHETANVVLLDPDGRVILQLRNKKNYDDHLAMYGGHLRAGQSHTDGALDEALQETGLPKFEFPMIYIGQESYDNPGDSNRERRSWFIQQLTEEEWGQMKKKKMEEDKAAGVEKSKVDRDTYKKELTRYGKRHDGKGEVTGFYPFTIKQIEEALKLQLPNSDSKLVNKNCCHLIVKDIFSGKDEFTDAFFTPDSLDLFVKNPILMGRLKTIILVKYHYGLVGAGTVDEAYNAVIATLLEIAFELGYRIFEQRIDQSKVREALLDGKTTCIGSLFGGPDSGPYSSENDVTVNFSEDQLVIGTVEEYNYGDITRNWLEKPTLSLVHMDEPALSGFRKIIHDAQERDRLIESVTLINILPFNSALRNALHSMQRMDHWPNDAEAQFIIKKSDLTSAEQAALTLLLRSWRDYSFKRKSAGETKSESPDMVKQKSETRQVSGATQLFDLVESALNNERAKFIKIGNKIAGDLDEKMTSVEIKERIEKATEIASVASLSRNDVDIEYLKNNLAQFEADGGVASLIILARRAKKEGQKLIIGLETDWMPGSKVKDSLQWQAIATLMKEIDRIGESIKSMGMDNVEIVRGSTDELAGSLAKTAKDSNTSMRNIVVMASKSTIKSDSFEDYREANEKDKPFLTGIDPAEFIKLYEQYGESVRYQLHIELASLLYMTLEVASGKEPPKASWIQYDKVKRLLMLTPDAKIMDYEKLKDTYKAEVTALQAA